ncbi:MAG TPA: methyltransferase [Gammaproteobacteria bacterium]|nr:methyltransferase [Gammaproteobacteria bacterium]
MTTERVDTTRLQRISRAYTETAVFYAALDLAVFSHVAAGADDVGALVRATGMSELNAERLVTVLLAMGLLERRDGRLVNAPDAARFLVRGEAAYAGDWMMFTRADVPKWFELTAILTDPTPPTLLGMYADLTVESARAYHAATYSIGMGAGKRFCRTVDLRTRRKLLDLGGGSGAYSINAVQRFPQLRAVVLDLPPVVEVTREYLVAHGVSDRVETLPGDFTATAFPEDCDVAVMASNLPIYAPDVIQRVVSKVYAALLPSGEFHLIGEMLDADGGGPLDPALWGMHEAICGSRGKAHTVTQCIDYLRAAGFAQVAAADFVPGILTRVSGVKAG